MLKAMYVKPSMETSYLYVLLLYYVCKKLENYISYNKLHEAKFVFLILKIILKKAKIVQFRLTCSEHELVTIFIKIFQSLKEEFEQSYGCCFF